MKTIYEKIADELGVRNHQVRAAAQLLEEATVPFVARYRKEATGGLTDQQLRELESRLKYLNQLEDRRKTILQSIENQEKLTPELKVAIEKAETLVRLEDLYLPYRPKRRTKAQTAREAGLEPLAEALLRSPEKPPEVQAEKYLDEDQGIATVENALEGARFILAEDFSEDAELIGRLREHLWRKGVWTSRLVRGKEQEGSKFADYFNYREPIARIPSHRALALFRGRREGILRLHLEGAEERCVAEIARSFDIVRRGRAGDPWLLETVEWAWKAKILPRLERELEDRLWRQSEEEAIKVFAQNLRDLLLAAPAGPRPTLGLDPGYRTGVKVAALDGTGRVLEIATIYPHPPQQKWRESLQTLGMLVQRHRIELIAIGNGTASRETDRLVKELTASLSRDKVVSLIASEAGASVYSASELASEELPELDVSLRGAVSIGRRLQDPLAELVKIEPKAIGVGQYQHDLNQVELGEALEGVVEECVNAVGVDVNLASRALLERVSGLGPALARNLVERRDAEGPFRNRRELKKVHGLGAKTYEMAAGFLRIRGGDNPLDASAVHPEAYPVVEEISRATGKDVNDLIGAHDLLATLDPRDFVDSKFGEPTVRDILAELDKPGRDPRPDFETASFQEGVEEIEDLKSGMILEGVVSNVTHFGAFVDVGVHQDGLVHISELADRFVKDPREIVRAGDVVRVKVLSIDLDRKRIALSMKKG